MNIKNNIFILIGILVIIIAAGSLIFFNNYKQPLAIKEAEVLNESNLPVARQVKKEVVLKINDGEKESQIMNAEFFEGMTAFDLLKEKSKELGFNLKIKNYDIGVMIESIYDKKNGQNGKYWLYYVNNEMPQIAADKKELKPGDQVEFKFSKSSF